MSGVEQGRGLQVVKVKEGSKNRYELNIPALEGLLLRQDVRDKPVVVVSVAGAYRGGKSFLLDFFLRYLNAPRSSQQSGVWLGSEREPLKGFSWRAGCERETTGIHFWSNPIHVKLEASGEEVVVLLMDTQGTFDSESTIQDSSTIFALSTLIASTQLYNIFRNIQEDDLQHLHLFSDYGRLASDGIKAFQVLQFLVRDWPNAHEHPYGYKGGSSLLAKRLEMKQGQNQELLEVRQHLRSCFNDIRCFLMAHPGLTTEDPNFTGCLSDLSEKFRMGLLELVPSLFDPKHLSPKVIGGERVKGRDLCIYFQKYLEIFNSEELPKAGTILQGMAAVGFMTAMREARDKYDAAMKDDKNEGRSVTPAAVRARHQASLAQAIKWFNNKRKLGSPEDAKKYQEQLLKDLNACELIYVSQNEVQLRKDFDATKKMYDDAIVAVCKTQQKLCLHPMDFEDLHHETTVSALKFFDSKRILAKGEIDNEKANLERQFAEQYEHLCAVNEQNNNAAVLEARVLYVTQMKEALPYHSGVSTDALESHHETILDAATEFFNSKRNRSLDCQADDPYLEKLMEFIGEAYVEFERHNLKSNKLAMSAAELVYNTYVSTLWVPQNCCFHPEDLEKLHIEALEAALKDFTQNRADTDNNDCYKSELISTLERRYSDMKITNEYNNGHSVDLAFAVYTQRMDKHCLLSIAAVVLVIPVILNLAIAVPMHHKTGTEEAIAFFKNKRLGNEYDDDEYLDKLKKKLNTAYRLYADPILAIMRNLHLEIPRELQP